MAETVHDVLIRIRTEADKALKGLTQTEKQIDKVNKKVKEQKASFDSASLGVLFFGIAIKRTFDNVLKAGVSTFLKIAEASGIQNTALQKMAFYWDFLKFTIGATVDRVLEPLIPVIERVVYFITEFIQTHPNLTVWGLVIGSVVGGALALFGSLNLGLQAIGLKTIPQLLGSFANLFRTVGEGEQKLTTFKSFISGLGTTVGIGFAIADFAKLVTEGTPKLVSNIGKLLTDSGLILAAQGKGAAGGVLATIGLGVEILANAFQGQERTFSDRIQSSLKILLATVSIIPGPAGWVLGISLSLLNLSGFLDTLGQLAAAVGAAFKGNLSEFSKTSAGQALTKTASSTMSQRDLKSLEENKGGTGILGLINNARGGGSNVNITVNATTKDAKLIAEETMNELYKRVRTMTGTTSGF